MRVLAIPFKVPPPDPSVVLLRGRGLSFVGSGRADSIVAHLHFAKAEYDPLRIGERHIALVDELAVDARAIRGVEVADLHASVAGEANSRVLPGDGFVRNNEIRAVLSAADQPTGFLGARLGLEAELEQPACIVKT